MNSKSSKTKPNKKVKQNKLTPQEIDQRNHKKEIRSFLKNIGYTRFPSVDGKEFFFNGRTGEIDDLFYNENIVLIVEYTTGSPGDHLLKKKIIYDLILKNCHSFLDFLTHESIFFKVKEVFEANILSKYTLNQIQVRILHASKQKISQEHRDLVSVIYLDYHIVKYFESISRVIKKTAIYEFHDFIGIKNDCFSRNINKTTVSSANTYDGHILPEEHSSFKNGYKLISFYIDANSLMRRAYVLRNGSWRDKEQISLYQRLLSPKKINSMRKYLNGEQRVFVNNIIATLPEDKVALYSESGDEIKITESGYMESKDATKVQPAKISIQDDVNIIGIIDGQHRTFAYHEGSDKYEERIAGLRNIQNLLVTGILFPKNESEVDRLKFQAKLFLEINSTQQSAASALKHDIESSLDPFSPTSIAKYVINQLNESGALASLFELYWYEQNKIKTTTIISFGLRPIVKLSGDDSFFFLWKNPNKEDLKKHKNYELLYEYQSFCVKELSLLFSALKSNIPKNRWEVSKRGNNAVLNLTFINASINCLRQLIKNHMNGDFNYYRDKFKHIDSFNFSTYKTTHYNRMGIDWFNLYFRSEPE